MTGSAGRPSNRAAPLPFGFGRLFEPFYLAAVNRRNRRFDSGAGVRPVPIPVISVGNLSVGGTGKTPMVEYVVRTLLAAGARPCIALRGYTPRGSDPDSDEASLYRRRLPNVPVLVNSDRHAAISQHLALAGPTTADRAVLDDGFQHRRLARDLDIVLIDCSRDPFQDRALPAGWLREPVSSLRRATCTVLTHSEAAEPHSLAALENNLAASTGHPPLAVCRHSWCAFLAPDDSTLGPDTLRAKRIIAASAIGNPAAFVSMLAASGAVIAGELRLRDHAEFDTAARERIASLARSAAADFIVCTEKDWVKLARSPDRVWPCPVIRPDLSLRFDRGEADLRRLILNARSSRQP